MPSIFSLAMSENSPGQCEVQPRPLQTLPDDLKRHLRSGVAISSFTQCIEELVRVFSDFSYISFNDILINDCIFRYIKDDYLIHSLIFRVTC